MRYLLLPKRLIWLFLFVMLAYITPISRASERVPNAQMTLTVSIDSPTVSSYGSGGFFTVSLNQPAQGDTFIQDIITDGTAFNHNQYEMQPSGGVTIPNGQTSAQLSFTILPGGMTYNSIYFTVTVYNPVTGIGVTGKATLTGAPLGLTATATSFSEINLTWMNSVPGISENQIERSPDGVNNWQIIDSVAGNETEYMNSGLSCGTTYYYRVRGFDSSGSSFTDYSNIATAKSDACTAPGAAPQPNFFTTSTPTLTWNRVIGATSYDLQISSNSAFTGSTPMTGLQGLSYTTSSLDNGVHYWRVRAVVGDTPGAWSTTQKFTVDVR